MAHNINQTSKN